MEMADEEAAAEENFYFGNYPLPKAQRERLFMASRTITSLCRSHLKSLLFR